MTLEDSVRRHRLLIMQRAATLGNVTRACQEAGISRTLFYHGPRRRRQPDAANAIEELRVGSFFFQRNRDSV